MILMNINQAKRIKLKSKERIVKIDFDKLCFLIKFSQLFANYQK